MARKSVAALSVVTPLPTSLPPVPDDLTSRAERELWQSVVESKPADWFGPDSLPVLKEYVRACITCDLLADKVRTAIGGNDASTVKFFLDIRDKESRRVASLATKLRLTQQSRYVPHAAGRANQRASGKRPWQD